MAKKPPHGQKSVETLGRIALNGKGDWIQGLFIGTQDVVNRDGKEQKVHNFIGNVCISSRENQPAVEGFGEFGLWGSMNLNNILTEDKQGMTLVIECSERKKTKAGDREFSTYRWSESLETIEAPTKNR